MQGAGRTADEYISKLKDDEVLRIWKETETGMNSNVEPENVPIDSLKFDLEKEIIYEITIVVWNYAENYTLH